MLGSRYMAIGVPEDTFTHVRTNSDAKLTLFIVLTKHFENKYHIGKKILRNGPEQEKVKREKGEKGNKRVLGI